MRRLVFKKHFVFLLCFGFIVLFNFTLYANASSSNTKSVRNFNYKTGLSDASIEVNNPDAFYERYITNSRSKNIYTYFEYLELNTNVEKHGEVISINASQYSDVKFEEENEVSIESNYKGKTNVLKIDGDEILLEYQINVPKTGYYNISLDYIPVEKVIDPTGNQKENRMSIELSVLINDELPFREASLVKLTRLWKNETEIQQDSRGNEFTPNQVQFYDWQEGVIRDSEGLYNNENFKFYLTEGQHKLSIFNIREPYAIKSINLFEEKELKPYSEIAKEYNEKGYQVYSGENIKYQGEHADVKSDQTLRPVSEYTSPYTEPSSIEHIKMNVIGQLTWQKSGQWLAWDIEVEQDGLYEIAFRSRQGYKLGLTTARTLYVDGEIPFEEAKAITFDYTSGFVMKSLGDKEGNPYLIYLTKGKHEIKLEVAIGDFARSTRNLEDIVFDLNDVYRSIIMITGTNPDLIRDYDLHKEITFAGFDEYGNPKTITLVEHLQKYIVKLQEELDYIQGITGQKGSEVIIEKIIVQLESFIKDRYTIPARINDFKNNVSALSAWALEIRDQPLEIDYFILTSPNNELPKAEANFLEKIWYEIRLLFVSFFVDYNVLGSEGNGEMETITLWVNWGRDQAQVLQNLIDNKFTPEHNIRVELKLVNASLIQGILSNNSPDVAVMVARGQPVNMAMRKAVYDISQFDDFKEVKDRFHKEAFVPYTYENGVYGLPDTQQFYMMFYRKDIFKEIGINPPNTWNEFYEVAEVLQRNNLQVGIPYSTISGWNVIDMGMGTSNIFPTLLYQNGGSMYNEDLTKVALTEPKAIEAYEQWIKMYTDYGFELTYDFYNRFRTGEMPIGIAPYGQFNQLSVAAPEIRNLWEMIPIPGTIIKDDNNEPVINEQTGEYVISRKTAGSGTASVILQNSDNKKEAWEFIKWWTEYETQDEYARQMEILMGTAARHSTANIEAFENLPWTDRERENLMKQFEEVFEIPEIPGGYYTSRGIDNAFRSTVLNQRNYRESLYKWVKEIDKEIDRKRQEFNLD